MVLPSFFNISLNFAIRSSWSELQSAPSLIFADCTERLLNGLSLTGGIWALVCVWFGSLLSRRTLHLQVFILLRYPVWKGTLALSDAPPSPKWCLSEVSAEPQAALWSRLGGWSTSLVGVLDLFQLSLRALVHLLSSPQSFLILQEVLRQRRERDLWWTLGFFTYKKYEVSIFHELCGCIFFSGLCRDLVLIMVT